MPGIIVPAEFLKTGIILLKPELILTLRLQFHLNAGPQKLQYLINYGVINANII